MTYRNDDVIALTNEMVFVKLNADQDTVLADEFGIAGFPTVVMIKSDGTEIDRIYGYAEPEEFIKTIRDYQAGRNTLADYLQRADTAATQKLYYMIAEKYVGRKKYTEAESYYRKILQEDPNNEGGYADSALFSIGNIKSRDKKYGAAEELFERFLNTYPESPLAEDVAFQIAHNRRWAEKYDEAIAGYKEILKTYPESKNANDVKIYIALTHDQKGDKGTALKLYQQFLIDHPDSPDTNWVRGKIEKIENPPEEEGEN